jgi:N-acetylmuramoyl-L-alanine amidase
VNTFIEPSGERSKGLKTPVLLGAVAALHMAGFGAFLFMQGCGTTPKPEAPVVTAPPAPPMPPKPAVAQPEMAAPKPAFVPAPGLPRPTPPTPAPEAAAGRTVTVQKGDSLSAIAWRYEVSARELAELNGIKDPSKIKPSQKLLLPAYARATPRTDKGAKPAPTAKPEAAKLGAAKPAAGAVAAAAPTADAGTYVVQKGDVISKIAARHGVTTKALIEANHLKSNAVIKVGDKLKIPGKAPAAAPVEAAAAPAPAPGTNAAAPAAPEAVPGTPAPAPAPAPAPGGTALIPPPPAPPAPASGDMLFKYTLKDGETLDDVARNFAVPKQSILSFNGITDEKSLKAGDQIKIPNP